MSFVQCLICSCQMLEVVCEFTYFQLYDLSICIGINLIVFCFGCTLASLQWFKCVYTPILSTFVCSSLHYKNYVKLILEHIYEFSNYVFIYFNLLLHLSIRDCKWWLWMHKHINLKFSPFPSVVFQSWKCTSKTKHN